MKRLILFLVSFSTLSSVAHAREFSNIYVFGDSLSDAGTYAGALGLPPAYAKFTTNPDNVWSEDLAARYNKSMSPVYSTEGFTFTPDGTSNNFAVGGARVELEPGVLGGPLAAMAPYVPTVNDQVNQFLSRGPLDRKALYSVWAGANDIFTQFADVAGQAIDVPVALANLQTAAEAEGAQITRLQKAGAKNLIVIGVPDVALTPFGSEVGPEGGALLSAMTSTFNNTLKASIAGKNLLYFDSSSALEAIIADPGRFGVTNTADPACGVENSSLGCVPGVTEGSVSAEQAAGYLFADGVHPSGTGHSVISDWIYSTLGSTGRMSLLATLPMGRSGAQWRSIDNRIREFQNFSYRGQGFFVTGDYAPGELDATSDTPGASGESKSVVVGYERALADDLFGGVTLGYSNMPVDLGSNSGKITYSEFAMSAFLSKKYGPLYGNVIATAALLEYDITRYTDLGIATYSDDGETRGNQFGVKFQGGYNFGTDNLIHGPLVGLAWEEVTVDGYKEDSGNFTAMEFGDQTQQQLRSRIGYQLQGNTEVSGLRLRPYAQLTYEYQFLNDNSDYTAGFAGSDNAMTVEVSSPTGGYGMLAVGGALDLNGSTSLSVDGTMTFGQQDAQNTSIGVTLSWNN